MEMNEYTTTIVSVRSDRKVAFVELDVKVSEIALGQQPAFKIIKGFGDLWRKYHDNSQLTIIGGKEREYFVTLAAFPTDRDGIGYVTIDSIVPTPEEIVLPQVKERRRKRKRKSQPKSFLDRLRMPFRRS